MQVGSLQSDTQSQVQTLGAIEQDFVTVKQQSSLLERKRILVETMLVQATGLSQRVSLFQELIQNTRSSIKSGFMLTSSTSLPLSLSRSYNLPMNFLSSFDETGFRPKVVLGSTSVPCDELSIYRLSATNSGEIILIAYTSVTRPFCLVKSRSQDAAANAGMLSVLYFHLQLFIEIEREYTLCPFAVFHYYT